jgi:hypothetical protein
MRWRFKNENYFTNSIFKINWKVQPVGEIGAKVTEGMNNFHFKPKVARFK